MKEESVCISEQRSVMKWTTAGVRMRRSTPPMPREMFGQSRFVLRLSRELIRRMDCDNAGIAGAPIFT